MGNKEINNHQIIFIMQTLGIAPLGGLALLAVLLLGCPSKPAEDDFARQSCAWNTNYVYVNGTCTCPEGFIEIGTEQSDYSCIPKSAGTFLMKEAEGCFCGSEIIFQISSQPTMHNPNNREFTMYYNGGSYLNFPLGCEYIPKDDGDEVFIGNTAEIICLDGISYFIEMRGKFNLDKTRMDAEVVFFELVGREFVRRDTCTFVLTQ